MLVGAPLIYLVIPQFIETAEFETQAGMDVLLYMLMLLAVIQPMIVSPLIERHHLKTHSTGGEKSQSPGQLYVTLSIIKFAVVETTFIYGLVVFCVTGSYEHMLWFYPIGAIWAVVYWPRRVKYEQFLQKLGTP